MKGGALLTKKYFWGKISGNTFVFLSKLKTKKGLCPYYFVDSEKGKIFSVSLKIEKGEEDNQRVDKSR